MNRNVVALALAMTGGLSATAAAQTATLYGRLYPEVVWTRMTGATQPGSSVSTLAGAPTGESFDSIVRTSRSARD